MIQNYPTLFSKFFTTFVPSQPVNLFAVLLKLIVTRMLIQPPAYFQLHYHITQVSMSSDV